LEVRQISNLILDAKECGFVGFDSSITVVCHSNTL